MASMPSTPAIALPRASEQIASRVRHGQIHDRRPALGNDVGIGLQTLSVLHLEQARLHEGRVEPDLPLDQPEAVIGHDEERGARRQARLLDGADDARDVRVEERHRRHRRGRARTVAMLRGVEVEQVIHHQVGLVPGDDVRRRLGPDVIAPDDVAGGEGLELGLREHAGLDELLRDRAVGCRALGKLPRHGRRRHDRHPIHLRRRHAARVREVVERLHADHLVAREPWLDAGRHAGVALEQSVEEHSVLRGRDAGDERGVVRPRHRRVYRPHAPGYRPARGQASQRRHRQVRVVERPTGEAVEADEHDVAGGGRRLRRCGPSPSATAAASTSAQTAQQPVGECSREHSVLRGSDRES